MQIIPVSTRKFIPPKDNLYQLFKEHSPPLKSKDIIVISSKIVAVHQGRCIKKDEVKDFSSLQQEEADCIISHNTDYKQQKSNAVLLSIKQNTFTAMSGIDESNANGYYILWPNDPFGEAQLIQNNLCSLYNIESLGVIISDSFLIPMRHGSVGISIGYFGIAPLKHYKNSYDIFGRALTMSQLNVVDSLATVANYYMGEGNEQIPIIVLRDAIHITFTQYSNQLELFISKEKDMYAPLLEHIAHSKK